MQENDVPEVSRNDESEITSKKTTFLGRFTAKASNVK